jgi:hypothetical protein
VRRRWGHGVVNILVSDEGDECVRREGRRGWQTDRQTDSRAGSRSSNLTLKISKQSGRWKGCRVPASTVN